MCPVAYLGGHEHNTKDSTYLSSLSCRIFLIWGRFSETWQEKRESSISACHLSSRVRRVLPGCRHCPEASFTCVSTLDPHNHLLSTGSTIIPILQGSGPGTERSVHQLVIWPLMLAGGRSGFGTQAVWFQSFEKLPWVVSTWSC